MKLLALLACCLLAAHAAPVPHASRCDSDHPANCFHPARRLLSEPDLRWRSGVVTIARIVGCTDEDEGTPCPSVEEVQDAVHNKVVNATVLAIESERPDARLAAWQGATLAFFFRADNRTGLDDGFVLGDVHAAVSQLEFCPVAGGNVLNITARLDAETTFEGAPVLDDLLRGTVVEVLVGHPDEMVKRGHEAHLVAHLGNSAPGPGDASC